MKTLYLECKMGAAGDMLMSALYELTEEKDSFLNTMNTIFGEDISVFAESETRSGIAGTHMRVTVLHTEEHADSPHAHLHHDAPVSDSAYGQHGADSRTAHAHAFHPTHSHHSYASILSRIDGLPLSEDVRRNAKAIYRIIGEAEANVHNSALEQIHFHEVGSLDALADVVGCCLLMELLHPEQILASPIHVGNGTVRCAHGVLPVPAPATAEILKGIPYYTGEIPVELCTPTGAAILKYFVDAFCNMPVLTVDAIGIGLGTKDLPVFNGIRAFYGDQTTESSDQILDLSCNLDDMTGEALGYAMEVLLDAGALDVFYESIQMKKNRPGVLLHCFCETDDKEKFLLLMMKHTTTRGIRFQTFSRIKLASRFEECQTLYGTVRKKVSSGFGITRSKYEYEDLRRIAKSQNLPLSEITEQL